jgi:hypothetical protein
MGGKRGDQRILETDHAEPCGGDLARDLPRSLEGIRDRKELVGEGRHRIDRMTRIRYGSLEFETRAIAIGLAAWDQAFKAPSVHGLPSVAAVAAYRAVLPEPEAMVRVRIEAALLLRNATPGERPN